MAFLHPMNNKTSANKTWLSPSQWKFVQASVPIVCVDVLPVRFSRASPDTIRAIGLILRDTPHQGRKWCLVGGRLLYGESLRAAIVRQVTETLGSGMRLHLGRDPKPVTVIQYSPTNLMPFVLDPRQHAVSLTYALQLTGSPKPQGEAVAYKWFDVRSLPSPEECGFGHHGVATSCLRRWPSAKASNLNS